MTNLQNSKLLSYATCMWMVLAFCVATAVTSCAQVTVTTIASFNGINGEGPNLMTLTQGSDGRFYGTTLFGGNICASCGTVFKVSSGGTLTTLHSFCSESNCADGDSPVGTLVQTTSNTFYGLTSGGGSNAGGTIFKITPAGELTTVYSFCAATNCSDGEEPFGGLIQNGNGNFYGTTALGGIGNGGTVFEITPAGALTTLYSFCALASCADGGQPVGTLVHATNGSLYGETSAGGIAGCGTIFKITPGGKLTTLFTFDFTNGCGPSGGLIQGANGDFYGVTTSGGSGGMCQASQNCGTAFKITAAGELTTLHNFCATTCADGAQPFGPLVQGTDGNLYGTTYGDNIGDPSTIFEITRSGKLTTLFTFSGINGYQPTGGLLQSTSGIFFGTTLMGGADNDGTVFSLSTGLGPFVKTQPTFAKEGATIGIFGQGFTGSSVVEFGGIPATDVKPSGSTFLFATVPPGALTGSVRVTTGGTTLTSNQQFRVTPQVLSFTPPSGSEGTQVTITGTGLTQTVGVGFGDNIPAQFTVNSNTAVTATVPAGAKTGQIGVVTKGGTAFSSTTFTLN